MKVSGITFLFFGFFLVQTVSFSQVKKNALASLLEKAYKQKSVKKLDLFFSKWHKEIPAISDSELHSLNPVQQEAYHLFSDVYTVRNLSTCFGLQPANNGYKGGKYIVLQNEIEIATADKIQFDKADSEKVFEKIIKKYKIDTGQYSQYIEVHHGKKTLTYEGNYFYGPDFVPADQSGSKILNFRPVCHFYESIPVFVNAEYASVFCEYLGPMVQKSFFHVLRSHKTFNMELIDQELLKKQLFVKPYIATTSGQEHLSGIPHAVYFSIDKITFDKSLTNARISFNNCESILKKQNGNWVLVSTNRLIQRGVE